MSSREHCSRTVVVVSRLCGVQARVARSFVLWEVILTSVRARSGPTPGASRPSVKTWTAVPSTKDASTAPSPFDRLTTSTIKASVSPVRRGRHCATNGVSEWQSLISGTSEGLSARTGKAPPLANNKAARNTGLAGVPFDKYILQTAMIESPKEFMHPILTSRVSIARLCPAVSVSQRRSRRLPRPICFRKRRSADRIASKKCQCAIPKCAVQARMYRAEWVQIDWPPLHH